MNNIRPLRDCRYHPPLSEHEKREVFQVNRLHELVRTGDMEACRALIIQNPRIVNCIKDEVGSALHCAAAVGHVEVINNLIEMGADPDIQYLSHTPLHLAVCMSRTEAVKALLKKGSNPEAYRDGGFNPGPLQDACLKGDIEIAQALIEAGASIDRHDYEGVQPLHYAAIHDDPDLIQMLLEAGADPNMRADRSYRTPIHRAASYGNLRTVRALLAGGADPDGFRVNMSCCKRMRTVNHFPPIAFAIINDHYDVVAELVQSGADLKSPVEIKAALGEVVDELNRNSWKNATADYNPCAMGVIILPERVDVDVTTMNNFSNATPSERKIRETYRDPLPPCIDQEKREKLFGKFGPDHPVFDVTMEPLKYSVYTEKAEIIGLLLSSGKYSSREIDAMKSLAGSCQLTRSLEALNKNSGSNQPESINVLTGRKIGGRSGLQMSKQQDTQCAGINQQKIESESPSSDKVRQTGETQSHK